jgi:hypothetical protein
MNHLPTQIVVGTPPNAAEARLATGGVLSGYQPNPCGEFAA